MVIVESYSLAVAMCFITMLCWGSWANTQKLATKEWRFQLFYWDYSIGVLLLTLILALTMGSTGSLGRGFIADVGQADTASIGWAMLGGVVFNLANILLVVAIDIAGMAVAFPIGIGLALVLGVFYNYLPEPEAYNEPILFIGVACITVAIIVNALAYKKLSTDKRTTKSGVIISIVCGIIMSLFFFLVTKALAGNMKTPEAGKLTPYTALVFFSLGLFLSNFIINTFVMAKPFNGEPVPFGDYFRKGTPKLHIIGILGGAIWGVGMSFSLIAGDSAGYAISYGLGQGATLVAAVWGVFIWKEFKNAPKGTSPYLAIMFLLYIIGLISIIKSNIPVEAIAGQ
jgi:glucose uptake protein